MGNPRFTTADAAMVQRHVRLAMQNVETDPAKPANYKLTVMQCYEIAAEVLDRTVQKSSTAGHFVDDWGQLKPIKGSQFRPTSPEAASSPRVPCTTHREKTFTFKDGTVKSCCTADDCEWGRSRKTHSNTGLIVVIPEEAEPEPEEISADDPSELSMEEFTSKIDIDAEVPEQEVGVLDESPTDDEELLSRLNVVEESDDAGND